MTSRTATIRLFLAVAVIGLITATVGACATTASDDTPGPGPSSASLAAGQQATDGPVAGYSVTIPKLHETSSLVGLGLNPDHSIQVPPLADPMQAGVYTHGPMPGDPGPAVILAHVNGGGHPGFGEGFHTLAAGDEINTTGPHGPRTFRVTRVATVPKGQFPTSDVYSDVPGPELRLITCGGELDASAHNYLAQVLVWAQQA